MQAAAAVLDPKQQLYQQQLQQWQSSFQGYWQGSSSQLLKPNQQWQAMLGAGYGALQQLQLYTGAMSGHGDQEAADPAGSGSAGQRSSADAAVGHTKPTATAHQSRTAATGSIPTAVCRPANQAIAGSPADHQQQAVASDGGGAGGPPLAVAATALPAHAAPPQVQLEAATAAVAAAPADALLFEEESEDALQDAGRPRKRSRASGSGGRAAHTAPALASGSDDGGSMAHMSKQDARKLARKQSNREAARRSRMRKQAESESVQQRLAASEAENAALHQQLQQLRALVGQLNADRATLVVQVRSLGGEVSAELEAPAVVPPPVQPHLAAVSQR